MMGRHFFLSGLFPIDMMKWHVSKNSHLTDSFFSTSVLLSRISIYLSPLQRKDEKKCGFSKKNNIIKERTSLVNFSYPSSVLISFSDKERISVVEPSTFLIPRSDHAETWRPLGREHAIRRPPRALLLCGRWWRHNSSARKVRPGVRFGGFFGGLEHGGGLLDFGPVARKTGPGVQVEMISHDGLDFGEVMLLNVWGRAHGLEGFFHQFVVCVELGGIVPRLGFVGYDWYSIRFVLIFCCQIHVLWNIVRRVNRNSSWRRLGTLDQKRSSCSACVMFFHQFLRYWRVGLWYLSFLLCLRILQAPGEVFRFEICWSQAHVEKRVREKVFAQSASNGVEDLETRLET